MSTKEISEAKGDRPKDGDDEDEVLVLSPVRVRKKYKRMPATGSRATYKKRARKKATKKGGKKRAIRKTAKKKTARKTVKRRARKA